MNKRLSASNDGTTTGLVCSLYCAEGKLKNFASTSPVFVPVTGELKQAEGPIPFDDSSARLAVIGGAHIGGKSDPGDKNLLVEGKLRIINAPLDSNGETLRLGDNTTSANLRLGYNVDYSWIQSHGSKPLHINELGNDVNIGKSGKNVNVKGNLSVTGDVKGDMSVTGRAKVGAVSTWNGDISVSPGQNGKIVTGFPAETGTYLATLCSGDGNPAWSNLTLIVSSSGSKTAHAIHSPNNLTFKFVGNDLYINNASAYSLPLRWSVVRMA